MSGLQQVRPNENKSVQLSLFPGAALIEGSKVLQWGAEKHGGTFNWREKPIPLMPYISKVMRHLIKVVDGEDLADDSGKCHIAHALCDLAIMIDARSVGKLVDDRPTKGKSAELLMPGGHSEASHNPRTTLAMGAAEDPQGSGCGPAPGGSDGKPCEGSPAVPE